MHMTHRTPGSIPGERRHQFPLIRATWLLLILPLSLWACGGLEPQPEGSDPELASSSFPLFGPIKTDGCGTNVTTIERAMRVGRFAAQTPEFAQCLQAYRPCSEDDHQSYADLLAITKSWNPTLIKCRNLDGSTRGRVSWWDKDGYGHSNDEELSLDNDVIAQAANLWAAGEPGGLFLTAGIIWHEAMHTHDYSHGDNRDADEAAEECDQDHDPTWHWRRNSAPYLVGRCINGAYTDAGMIDPDQPGPGTASTSTIVDKYYADAHKRLVAAQRASVLGDIVNGTLLWPWMLKLTAAGNSLPWQATPVAIGGTADDEVFDAQDKLYFSFSVATPRRVQITVEPQDHDAGSMALDLDGRRLQAGVDIASANPHDVVWTLIQPRRLSYLVDLKKAGTHLLKIAGSSAYRNRFRLTLGPGPTPTAPSCGQPSVLCDGEVNVSCQPTLERLVLQRLAGTGWTNVATDKYQNPKSNANLTDETAPLDGSVTWYRVCVLTVGGNATSCAQAKSVTLASKSSCGGGGSGSWTPCLDPIYRLKHQSECANWIKSLSKGSTVFDRVRTSSPSSLWRP